MQIPERATWRGDLTWGAAIAAAVPPIAAGLVVALATMALDALLSAIVRAALAVAAQAHAAVLRGRRRS